MKFLLIFPSLLGKFKFLLSEIFYKWSDLAAGYLFSKSFRVKVKSLLIINIEWTFQIEDYAILHSINYYTSFLNLRDYGIYGCVNPEGQQWCWWHRNAGELTLPTIFGYWCSKPILRDALMTKMAQTVTKILHLSTTHYASKSVINIDVTRI